MTLDQSNQTDLTLNEEDVSITNVSEVPSIKFSERVHKVLAEAVQQTVAVRILAGGFGYKTLATRIIS